MDRQPANYEFADALKQLWNTLKGLEDKPARVVKDDLLQALIAAGVVQEGRGAGGTNPFDYWGRGHLPAPRVVDFLAEAGVRQAKLPPEWLDRFLRAAGYGPALRAERARVLFPAPEPDDPPLSSQPFDLPARPAMFLGRGLELELIRQTLSSPWPICLVEGIGGAGKTTLAREVVHACAGWPRGAAVALTWPRFQFIVWTSAEAHPLTLEHVLDSVAHRLGYPRLVERPLDGKRRLVADLLARYPTLIVVDNFETILDTSLAEFLVQAPAGVKVLLTSRENEEQRVPIFRRWPPVRIRLGGLPDVEALAFLRHAAGEQAALHTGPGRTRLEAVVAAADATLEPLVRVAEGNPKVLSMALAYIADQAIPLVTLVQDLYAAADSVGWLFDHLFQHGWEHSSADARDLWRVIPFFAAPARAEALAAAAGLSGRRFHDALAELGRRAFLDCAEGPDGLPPYDAHPLVRAYAAARLREDPAFEMAARARWIAWYGRLADQAARQEDYAPLRPDGPTLLGALDWMAAQGDDAALGGFFRQIHRYLYAEGHWEPLLRTADRVAEWAAGQGVGLLLAATLENSIAILRHRGMFQECACWVKRAQQVAERLADDLLQAEIDLAQGRFQQYYVRFEDDPVVRHEAFTTGVTALFHALTIFRRHQQPSMIVQALNTLGNFYLEAQDYANAKRMYTEGLQELESAESRVQYVRRWQSTLEGNLALVAGREGDAATAHAVLVRVLPGLIDQLDQAEVCAALAVYAYRLHKVVEAWDWRSRVNGLKQHLSISRPICEEDAAWEHLVATGT